MMNIKDEIIAIALILFIALLIAGSTFWNAGRVSTFDALISNPTFVGEVVDKESGWRGGFGITAYTEHRLHIVGQYYYDGEKIQVDSIFIVPRSQYRQFNVGDLIGQ